MPVRDFKQLPSDPRARREEVIKALTERFYVNEQATLVANGLSTELMMFPSDLSQRNSRQLVEKIQNAMTYATSFSDVEELNALLFMPPFTLSTGSDYYLTLGLFLYLADECSRTVNEPYRRNTDKSFLTAMREAGAMLRDEPNHNRQYLVEKTLLALDILGMKESHGQIIDDWYRYTNYTVEGERHQKNAAGYVEGAYATLAYNVCQQQKPLGMNLAISYALGNKEAIAGMTPKAAYEFTQNKTIEGIKDCIKVGNRRRHEFIMEAIRKVYKSLPKGKEYSLAAASVADKEARGVLDQLPDAALELLYKEGYTCAYANDEEIRKCYPVYDLPGIDNESMRGGKGGRQKRYHIIFLSNGIRNDLEGNDHLRHQVVSQSLLHEIMHMAMSYLDINEETTPKLRPEEQKLRKAVEAVHDALKSRHDLPEYFNKELKTIATNKLSEVLDYESGLYTNYGKGAMDTRWEEVVCNLHGLLHTEFPRRENEPSGEPSPYTVLPELAALATQVDEVVATANARSLALYDRSKAEKKEKRGGGRD